MKKKMVLIILAVMIMMSLTGCGAIGKTTTSTYSDGSVVKIEEHTKGDEVIKTIKKYDSNKKLISTETETYLK